MTNNDDFSFFDLDEHALDREWVQQARLYFDHAVKVANTERKVKEMQAELDVSVSDLKHELAVREAEVDRDVRTRPEFYGLEKLTEPGIKNCLVLDLESRRITAEIGAKKFELSVRIAAQEEELGILKAACKALDHRKAGLENLVELQGRNYFAEPTAKDPTINRTIETRKNKEAVKQANKRITRKERAKDE